MSQALSSVLRRTLASAQSVVQSSVSRRQTRESNPGDSPFEVQWRKLSREERFKAIAEYYELSKKDWKELTLEQKRNIYTTNYGVDDIKDPQFISRGIARALKIAIITVGFWYLFLKTARHAKPTTLTKEHVEAQKQYEIDQKANAIYGAHARHVKEEGKKSASPKEAK